MAKMSKKSHERKTLCCSWVRSQQKMVYRDGKGWQESDLGKVWRGGVGRWPGLLNMAGCNFCWINSLYFALFCLSSCPQWFQPPLHPVMAGKEGTDVHLLSTKGQFVSPALVPVPLLPSPSSSSRYSLLWASDSRWGLCFFFVPLFSFYLTRKSQWWHRFSVASPAKKKTPGFNLFCHCTELILQKWHKHGCTEMQFRLSYFPNCYW